MVQRLTRAESEAEARRRGWIVAEADDPVYSEGPSITFCAHTSKHSGQKGIISLPGDSPSNSDSTKDNDE